MEIAATSLGCLARTIQLSSKYDVGMPFLDLLPAASAADTMYAAQCPTSADAMAAHEAASTSRPEIAEGHGLTLRAAIDAFKKEASMTPVQKARRDALKAMKITEGDLKAMCPDQRDILEKRIAGEVIFLLRKRGQSIPKGLEVAARKVLDRPI